MINDFKKYPVTSFLTIILTLIFFTQGKSAPSCEQSLIQMYLNNFIHTHSYHLFLSLICLHSYRDLEDKQGWRSYLIFLCMLTMVKTLIYCLLNDFASVSTGFYSVMFALYSLNPGTKLLGIQCEPQYYSLILLVFAQSIPFTSFCGNLSGILTGHLLKFLADTQPDSPQPTTSKTASQSS